MGNFASDRPGEPPGSFSAADARRIAVQTRWAERRLRNPPPQRARYPVAGAGVAVPTASQGKVARTGSDGIPAMTGLTPGSGAVELYDFTTSSLVDKGDSATAYNVSNDAVAANTVVVLMKVDGKWVVILEPCPASYY